MFPRLSLQVVGYDEIMEMLTNYDYTIDYINDAGGAAETWGTEAGHGIMSARKMLGWVKANCQEACPGELTGGEHARSRLSYIPSTKERVAAIHTLLLRNGSDLNLEPE